MHTVSTIIYSDSYKQVKSYLIIDTHYLFDLFIHIQPIRMICEASCDTKDWMAAEKSALSSQKIWYILTY